jgi:hypothetical protein
VSDTTINYLASPPQLEALQSQAKRILLLGGNGSGKTDTGSCYVLKQAMLTPDIPGIYGVICANSYGQLKDSTLRNLFKNLASWGIDYYPKDLPLSNGPFSIWIWNGRQYIECLCRSLDHWKFIAGLESAWVWSDEAWATSEVAINELVTRCRDLRHPSNQILITSLTDEPYDTETGEKTWMYSWANDSSVHTIYAPTFSNPIYPPGCDYIALLQSTLSSREFDRRVKAKWVTVTKGAIYYSFDRKIHINDALAEYDPSLPIYWSHDFNISAGKPMSSVLYQLKRRVSPTTGRPRTELTSFDEIVIGDRADTHSVIEEFESRPWLALIPAPLHYLHLKRGDSGGLAGSAERLKWVEIARTLVEIGGDATGVRLDTRSRTSDYKILSNAGYTNQSISSINPLLRDRHNICNALLHSADGDVRAYFHSRCSTLVQGLETGTLRKGSKYAEEDSYSQHVTTAWGYSVCRKLARGGMLIVERGVDNEGEGAGDSGRVRGVGGTKQNDMGCPRIKQKVRGMLRSKTSTSL